MSIHSPQSIGGLHLSFDQIILTISMTVKGLTCMQHAPVASTRQSEAHPAVDCFDLLSHLRLSQLVRLCVHDDLPMQVMTTRAASLAGIWAGWRLHTFPQAHCTTSSVTSGWTASRAMPRLCAYCRCKPQPNHRPQPCCSLAVCLCVSASVPDPSQCLPASTSTAYSVVQQS